MNYGLVENNMFTMNLEIDKQSETHTHTSFFNKLFKIIV